MHLFVRFSQFQNYHTNMKRLDITLTKFIKLHDCIPVNVRFAVYTQNFLSLNSMSWYKTNHYTEDPFRTHPLLVHLSPRERGTFFRITVFFRISTLFCFKKLSLSPNWKASDVSNEFQSLLNYRHVKTTLTELFHWDLSSQLCREYTLR